MFWPRECRSRPFDRLRLAPAQGSYRRRCIRNSAIDNEGLFPDAFDGSGVEHDRRGSRHSDGRERQERGQCEFPDIKHGSAFDAGFLLEVVCWAGVEQGWPASAHTNPGAGRHFSSD